jgi:transaldolase
VSDSLRRVHDECGQSPWLDNLRRSYLNDGTLQSLVDRGVRGLTSNPTIFQKAIQGSTDYDEQFEALIRSGATVEDAYWALVIDDIVGALDVFGQVHDSSNGVDGFVSIEVDPSLARDTAGTLAAARTLHQRINRPNVMIKIPATEEGLPVIRQMIAEGRSVNVTLIFSLERYEQVIDAYIGGITDRVNSGADVSQVQSVASFFISRVDNAIDPILEGIGTDEALGLRGSAAVNQAKLAYRLFLDKFSGEQWQILARAGAHVQRPLWASTSTKNPAYRDTLYVDEIIGPHTVNTLPEPTLEAFADHGTVAETITVNVDRAIEQWNRLNELGIDVRAVAAGLESDGVSAFVASFDELMQALTEKASTFG